ncbi:hypothetical protein, partial [Xanthomonas perforans]|uniref:hypothetical protein n=1 Tax=Xanthomonas perforans TaxID=442694 RepID=UPI001F417E60
ARQIQRSALSGALAHATVKLVGAWACQPGIRFCGCFWPLSGHFSISDALFFAWALAVPFVSLW